MINSTNLNPLEKVLEWYEKLPESHKVDLAFLSGMFLVGFIKREYETEEMKEEFKKFFDSSDLSGIEIMQRTILIKGLIDYSIDKKATGEDWIKNAEFMELYKRERIEGGEKIADIPEIQNLIETIPERAEEWINSCNKWSEITSTYLSNPALNQWYLDFGRYINMKYYDTDKV